MIVKKVAERTHERILLCLEQVLIGHGGVEPFRKHTLRQWHAVRE